MNRYECRMVVAEECGTDPLFRTPEAVVEYCKEELHIHEEPHECVYAFYLNAKGKCIGYNIVSIGGLCSSIVEPREVFRGAILRPTHGIIIVHNHPSGDCTPSEADNAITKNLAECGKMLGIPVIDHIVIGDSYYSYKKHNEI